MSDAEQRLLEILRERSFKRAAPGESFTLVSGEKSEYFIDGKMTAVSPAGAELIGEVLYDRTRRLNVDAIGGLQVGAVPLVTSAVIDQVRANPNLLPSIPELDDDALREQLTAIKGIGPWTVDMLLIFGISRPDVLPVGDYGIKVAVKKLFNLRELPDAAKLTRIARPWRPHRSVASWYLWRSLDLKGG